MLALVTIILNAYKLRLLLTAGINHINQAGWRYYIFVDFKSTQSLRAPKQPSAYASSQVYFRRSIRTLKSSNSNYFNLQPLLYKYPYTILHLFYSFLTYEAKFSFCLFQPTPLCSSSHPLPPFPGPRLFSYFISRVFSSFLLQVALL